YRADLPGLSMRSEVYRFEVAAEGRVVEIIYTYATRDEYGGYIHIILKHIRFTEHPVATSILRDVGVRIVHPRIIPLHSEGDTTIMGYADDESPLPVYLVFRTRRTRADDAVVVVAGGLSFLVYYTEVGSVDTEGVI
ncbi:MAG: hypothetical protein ACP5IE_05845, partial [Infirmifilum sp.]